MRRPGLSNPRICGLLKIFEPGSQRFCVIANLATPYTNHYTTTAYSKTTKKAVLNKVYCYFGKR